MKFGGQAFARIAKEAKEDSAKSLLPEFASAWVRRRLENSLKTEGGIRYLGQFKDLADLAPYVRDALLRILQDENFAIDLRLRSAQALGDVSDASILPVLRGLLDDFLIEEWLEQELGFLLARFGDRSFVEKEITAAQALLAREHSEGAAIPSLLEAHARLAEIYYRTAEYPLATRHYEQRIVLLEDLVAIVTTQVRQALQEEIAVLYYNLACAHALTGRLDDAYKALETALEKRGVSMQMLENDGDLLALRQDDRYSAWFANQRTKLKQPQSKPPE
ncbi:MAG: TPR end-of-group domain-containing protein [Planctomycetota bacterium]